MRTRVFRFLCFCSFAAAVLVPRCLEAQAEAVSAEERAAFHRAPEWLTIAPHLPDPSTASARQLETAADVLRARRFPEDALDYYGYAVARGGNLAGLLNKMGVVRLELRQTDVAHELFQRVVRADKRNATGWNNLGVTEYAGGHYHAAIQAYRKAARLQSANAVFRANLGMAYFENKDLDNARDAFKAAMRLDPGLLERGDGGGGAMLHVVGSKNYGQLAFEMARVFAQRHDPAGALLWLAKSCEAGYDIRTAMTGDITMDAYLRDPGVVVLLKNAQQMRSPAVAAVSVKSLGEADGIVGSRLN